MLINASILANQCVTGALFRQSALETTANAVKSLRDGDSKPRVDTRNDRPSNGIKVDQPVGGRRSSIKLMRGRISRSSIQIANGIKRSNAVAILTNIRLIFFNISVFLRGFAYFACLVNLVALCVDSGISKVDAAFLLSIMGICSGIARLSHGIIIDKKLITALHFQSLAQVIAAISCILIGISSTFVTMTIFVIVFGTSSGIFLATTINALKQLVAIHLFRGAVAVYMSVQCAGGLLGVPTGGK